MTNPLVPALPASRCVRTFHAISDDVDDARVYGGIHYRFDQSQATAGRAVATHVYKNNLRKTN